MTPIEAAVLDAYGLLEGASTYGRRQAIKAAMDALRPVLPADDLEVGKHG